MHIREFTRADQNARSVDSDAPDGLRQELIDLIFLLATSERSYNQLTDKECYQIIAQSCGVRPSNPPSAGFRGGAGRTVELLEDWRRVYDLALRFVPEFQRLRLFSEYREGVNRILSAYGIVWELNERGRLDRVLPEPVMALVASAIEELGAVRFVGASEQLAHAIEAFNDRPRREREVCINAYNALETTAKAVYEMPAATLGAILEVAQRRGHFDEFTRKVLGKVEVLRHNRFGHGMTTEFRLKPTEVDFIYLTCLGGILLFARTSTA